MRFLIEAVKVLEQLSKSQDSKDIRNDQALAAMLADALKKESSFPPHIRENANAAYDKWHAFGISPDEVLPSIKLVTNDKPSISPALASKI
jgi:hypothetical protein